MTDNALTPIAATADIAADPATIFELIADPAQQPTWDGNDNLAEAGVGQRITADGQAFTMRLTTGADRENRITAFEEGRLIEWAPGEVGGEPFGQRWRWELTPILDADGRESATRVTHTYDPTRLDPATSAERRLRRAAATTEEMLAASIARLRRVAEGTGSADQGTGGE
ncbi:MULTISPECIES: SRPBCC family protein [Helcobacillus]|uniref:Uncharacterized protein YndB with AHSA1/START domain n=1 Tax=Helcobacillus massiliensis TaxID=521392 RepID=A0A839QU62_9MICO|nr:MULTISPECIES: SRPBCC family protein [Helcobacillus]MBB3024013.1 uncharacterized protein YndB with AHSA1/START domain [Helcobacillus massiliensis]MCG7427668.1 SRPBCC family protein [Helcobacillus sp. ACRRO]